MKILLPPIFHICNPFFVFIITTQKGDYLQYHTYINFIKDTLYVHCITILTINIYATYIVLLTLLTM